MHTHYTLTNYKRIRTRTHKARFMAVLTWVMLLSVPKLVCLCTTQTLEPCKTKSSWGRASNPQEDCPGPMDRGCRTWKFHNDPTSLNKTRTVEHQLLPGTYWCYRWVGYFHSWHQAIRSLFNRWVDWSIGSKVSCSRKQQHQSGIKRHRTHNLLNSRLMPWPLS